MSIDRPPPKPQLRDVTATTRSLIVGLKGQDDGAWMRLVRLYTPLVYHWCQRHNLSHDDILDVVQEVFRAVAENIDRFRKERTGDTFRGWLRVITRSKAMDVHRRSRNEVRGAGGSEALRRLEAIPAPERAVDAEADRIDDTEAKTILFRRALELVRENFRERTWTAFWRVVVDERTPAEVADEMGMNPGAVRVAKSRVLQRLRLELDGELDPSG